MLIVSTNRIIHFNNLYFNQPFKSRPVLILQNEVVYLSAKKYIFVKIHLRKFSAILAAYKFIQISKLETLKATYRWEILYSKALLLSKSDLLYQLQITKLLQKSIVQFFRPFDEFILNNKRFITEVV